MPIAPKVLLYKFYLPVFKSRVWVVIGSTLDAAIDFVEDKTSEKVISDENRKVTRAYTYAYQEETGRSRYILFFKNTATPGEIAHECKHLVNILFNWCGFKLSLTNDEMECYYLEDIVNRAHLAIKRYNKIYTTRNTNRREIG